MITQVAQLTWKAKESMVAAMIPQFCESVAASGGKFLIFKNEYISVKSVVESKKLFNSCISNARSYLMEYLSATDELEEMELRRKMRNELYMAGSHYRTYSMYVSASGYLETINLDIPEFIASNPELKKHFDQGVSSMDSCLYEQSD